MRFRQLTKVGLEVYDQVVTGVHIVCVSSEKAIARTGKWSGQEGMSLLTVFVSPLEDLSMSFRAL